MVADWPIDWDLARFAVAQPLVLSFIVGAVIVPLCVHQSARVVHVP